MKFISFFNTNLEINLIQKHVTIYIIKRTNIIYLKKNKWMLLELVNNFYKIIILRTFNFIILI